jgi:magnesium transporter
MIRTLSWKAGQTGRPADDVRGAHVPALRRAAGDSTWVDVSEADDQEFRRISDAFGVDVFALRRASEDEQRPHFLSYDGYVRLSLRLPTISSSSVSAIVSKEGGTGVIPLDDLTLFFGPGFVLTVHDSPIPLVEVLARWWRDYAKPQTGDIEVLVHRIIDDTEDVYFPVLDRLADETETLQRESWRGENTGSDQDAARHMRAMMRIKRALLTMRRTTRAQRDALMVLARGELPYAPEGESPVSFQDVFDHAVRVDDAVQVYHEMLVRAREAYLTRIANDLAISAQRLLVYTCLALIPALVFGWYGQRFANMPELGLPTGHFSAILLAAACDGGMFYYFKRNRWM